MGAIVVWWAQKIKTLLVCTFQNRFLFHVMAHSSSSSIVLGKARFTVIAKACIRLEYSETLEFEDAPSLCIP